MKVDENLDEDNTNKKIERQWTRPIKNPINKWQLYQQKLLTLDLKEEFNQKGKYILLIEVETRKYSGYWGWKLMNATW